MLVIKFGGPYDTAGRFAAVPNPNEFPNQFESYALVQICQVRVNGNVPQDVATTLAWQPPADNIKIATLQPATGWFVDNFYINQNNTIYFMDSFNTDTQNGILGFLKNLGEDGNSTLYYINGHLQNQQITPEVFENVYGERLVAIGGEENGVVIPSTNPEQREGLPILSDLPQQPDGTTLNFEVHLVFLVNDANTPTLHVSKGFKWQYNVNQPSFFQSFIDQPSPDFTACMQAAVIFQNQQNHTNWVLAP